ncbi:MAG: lasso peptide biosynthesis B2 protein [Bacteroidales bacterium]|jgi:hypothetical protein|nr:lasso peptide biosynthesis B2 protein [Bacteroidales bacterium]
MRLIKFFKISSSERQMLIMLLWNFLIFSTITRLLPIRKYTRLIGEYKNESNYKLKDKDIETIKIFRKSLKRAKRIFLIKVKCQTEAISAKRVLKKFNIPATMYLGVSRNSSENLIAHAWLKSDNKNLTGGENDNKFTVVAYYS